MPNYKETNIQGTSWLRASRITIKNPKNEIPHLYITEEKVINTQEGEILTNCGELFEMFTPSNANTQFNLLNSSSGEITGTATYQDVYEMLYSVYIHLATIRDTPIVEVSPSETSPVVP